MKIHLMSDLHLEIYNDQEQILDQIPPQAADVCILAGDIADGSKPEQYQRLFEGLLEKYCHIIVVTGNHDYYKSTPDQTHDNIVEAIQKLPAGGWRYVHFLNKSSVVIQNQTFHGGALWFRSDPLNHLYRDSINDFRMIKKAKKSGDEGSSLYPSDWIYDEQLAMERHLNHRLTSDDVVITHHLPHPNSVHPIFKTSTLNRFFLCDMSKLIEERQPKLWVHGHTHFPFDYTVGATRVVCNPRGYIHERNGIYVPKLIEL